MSNKVTFRIDKTTLWFVLGLLVGAGLGYWAGARATRISLANQAAQSAGQPALGEVIEVSVDGRPSRGPTDAKVTIVEFTDYECSYCARYHQETFRPLIAEYEDRVKYVIRNFPLVPIHPHAAKAAEAAECAREQGRFWEYHGLLFDRQAALDEESLTRYAAELGLDESGFAACLLSGRNAEVVRADLEDGVSYGVAGTPTFFVNGRKLEGLQPLTAMKRIIDEAERESD
jgi:protein-disulfide isomerase